MSTYENEIKHQLNKYGDVQNIMPYFNFENLKAKHKSLQTNKATGVDNVTKAQYNINLDTNILELVKLIKEKAYNPKPVRRVFIPKLIGGKRPLGIPTYRDKLVQSLMAEILNIVYEPIFLDCSFGYRKNLTCHSALSEITHIIANNDINYIVEADIRHFFDEVNHTKLINMLQQKIKDRNFVYYIKKFLKAGVMENGVKLKTRYGTPQGRVNFTYIS